MKIALLGSPGSLHVRRFVSWLVGRGHQVLVSADSPQDADLPGVQMARPHWDLLSKALAFRLTPQPHGNSIWKCLPYRPLIRQFDPDVIHGHEVYFSGLATAWGGAYPKVLSAWGNDVLETPLRGPIWRMIVRTALRGVDRITGTDPTLPQFLHRHFGVSPERVTPFSWGIDLTQFRRLPESSWRPWLKRLHLQPDDQVVFSPRKFHPYWGSEDILQAMPRLARASGKLRLVLLAGTALPGEVAAAKDRIRAMGVESSVRWVEEPVTSAEMGELFNLAPVFLSCPRTDMLSATLLEGMACGSFPITADLPAYAAHLPIDLPTGPNAFVVPRRGPEGLAEAVLKAFDAPAHLAAASRFNQARMIQMEDGRINLPRIETIYEEAIQSHRFRTRGGHP